MAKRGYFVAKSFTVEDSSSKHNHGMVLSLFDTADPDKAKQGCLSVWTEEEMAALFDKIGDLFDKWNVEEGPRP